MTEKIRLTYRLSNELYQKIAESAKRVTVNTEINWVLWEHYFEGSGSEKRQETMGISLKE